MLFSSLAPRTPEEHVDKLGCVYSIWKHIISSLGYKGYYLSKGLQVGTDEDFVYIQSFKCT